MKRHDGPSFRASFRPLLVLLAVLPACKTCRGSSVSVDAGAAAAGVTEGGADGQADAASALVVPPRCRLVANGPDIGASVLGESVELGQAVVGREGEGLVGLLRTANGRRLASVARLSDGAKQVRVIDLGSALGDAPAPVPLVVGEDTLAFGYARAGGDAGSRFVRELSVFRLTEVVALPLPSISQQTDESPAFDVALSEGRVAVAWDEVAPPTHGVIKVALLASDLKSSEVHVASPDTSDADSPNLAPRPGGYWLSWIAHKQEPLGDAAEAALPPSDLEGPGESRAFQWLELASLDAEAKPVGAVRRLTSQVGHVSAFTLVTHGPALEVFARDDHEAYDGAGGRILRVRVQETPEAPVALVPDGVGRGEPTWLSNAALGERALLFYVDVTDRNHLLPLPGPGAPLVPSLEPALDDARPLLALGLDSVAQPLDASSSASLVVIAGAPNDARHLLRALTCTP